jgi:hypothetical protein
MDAEREFSSSETSKESAFLLTVFCESPITVANSSKSNLECTASILKYGPVIVVAYNSSKKLEWLKGF